MSRLAAHQRRHGHCGRRRSRGARDGERRAGQVQDSLHNGGQEPDGAGDGRTGAGYGLGGQDYHRHRQCAEHEGRCRERGLRRACLGGIRRQDGTMHFGIPEGRPGRDGTDGAPGAKGDKGDPGGQGPKGDPGSDASVTVENIEAALGYAPVKDVQVAGTSVLTDGVANVPIADIDILGVIKAGNATESGLWFMNGVPRISFATDDEISSRNGQRKAIVCNNLDKAVKAAMCDGKGAAWTSAEQKAARERMGVDGGYELIEEITIAEENVSVIARDVNRLRSAKMVIICPPMESIITANALIFFGDASKPQYIYLFSEIAPSKVGRYRHITLETELRNNYWRVYKTTESETGDMYPNGSWTTSIGETAPSRLMQLPSSNLDAITKITLNAYPTGAYIPVGTKIMIYGVRA